MKKKKTAAFLILIFLFALFFTLPAAAEGEEAAIREKSGMDAIWENLPDGIERSEVEELTKAQDGKSAFTLFTQKLLEFLSFGLSDAKRFFASVCAVLLAVSILKSIRKSFGEEKGHIFDLIGLLVLSLFCYSALSSSLEIATRSIRSMNSFMVMLLPILTFFFALGGGAGEAAIQSTNLIFAIDLIDSALTFLVLPIIRLLFAFALSSAIAPSLQRLTQFLQKTAKLLCVFLFTVLCAILSLQSTLASAGDSVAMRGVRFAAGNFIPVVGGLVGEASKTLAGTLGLVKGECGILCFVIVLFCALTPILYLFIRRILLSLAGCLSSMLGDERSDAFLTSVRQIFDLLLSLVVSSSVYFLFAIILFLKSEVHWA